MGKRIPSSIELEKDYWLWLPKFLAVLFVGGLVCLVILTDFGETSHHISPQHLPLNQHDRDLGALPGFKVASETRPLASGFLENGMPPARPSERSEQYVEEASSGETSPSAEGTESSVDAAVRSQDAASSVEASGLPEVAVSSVQEASGQAEEDSSEDALLPKEEAQPRHKEASLEDFKVKEAHRAEVEPFLGEGGGLDEEQNEIKQEARSHYSPSVESTVANETDTWSPKLALPDAQERSAPSDTTSLFDALPPANGHTNKAEPLSLLMNISFTQSPPPGELRSKQAMEYPACRGEALLGSENITTAELKKILISKIMSADTYTKPFASSTYFCQIFPLHFYLDLIQSWPIDRVFTNYASKKNSCSSSGCRYYMTSTNIFKGTGGMAKKWDGYAVKKSIWQALSDAVFNPDFEGALFQKLGVTKKVRSREMRILSDKKGQSSGRVHTDMDARKVATMMLYTPPDHDTAQMWDYGTCLHSQDQFNKRKLIKESQGARKGPRGLKDGESQCFYKFRYLPNSGYAFKVHDSSWHSAPNSRIRHWKGTARNSILLNWYSKN